MTTTTKDCPIILTEGAKKEIRHLQSAETKSDGRVLRIGVKGGGCSGLSYILEFDDLKEEDVIYEVDDIRLAISKSHDMYVQGMQVDFKHGLNNRGFSFSNPNATDTCGCGTSFTTE